MKTAYKAVFIHTSVGHVHATNSFTVSFSSCDHILENNKTTGTNTVSCIYVSLAIMFISLETSNFKLALQVNGIPCIAVGLHV